MNDLISRQAALALVKPDTIQIYDDKIVFTCGASKEDLEVLPCLQPQYEELTPEEAASEIASGSTMSAWYWLDDMIRLKQMGYVICRKR